MARVRSTARVTRDGEEAKAAETAPISEVMRQSGLVVPESASDEGASVVETEQADIEEGEADEEEIDYSVMPSKPSRYAHDDKARLLRGSREEADSFRRRRNHSEARR
jgi:hypothetical protein